MFGGKCIHLNAYIKENQVPISRRNNIWICNLQSWKDTLNAGSSVVSNWTLKTVLKWQRVSATVEQTNKRTKFKFFWSQHSGLLCLTVLNGIYVRTGSKHENNNLYFSFGLTSHEHIWHNPIRFHIMREYFHLSTWSSTV